MPSTRWIRSGARMLRDAVTSAHRRAEPLPRLPFVVALVVAVVALVAALEFRPSSEEATVELDERSANPGGEYDYGSELVEEEAAFEILEYGISKVVVDGLERLVVGAVVRNPYDQDLSPGALSLTAETERGYPVRVEDFYMGAIPAGASMRVGFVASSAGSELPVEELQLEAVDPSFLYTAPAGEAAEFLTAAVMPEVTLVETEPLLSPSGYRLRYLVDAPEETQVQMAVLFRDGEGRLLGGVPAGPEPFSAFHDGGGAMHYFALEAGETVHHVDLPQAWIPEGADPDRFEVSPSA